MKIKKSLTLTIVCFAIAPIIVITVFNAAVTASRAEIADRSALSALAYTNGRALEEFALGQIRELELMSLRSELSAELSRSDGAAGPAAVKILLDWVDSIPHYANAWLIDETGRVIISCDYTDVGRDVSQAAQFKDSMRLGLIISRDAGGVRADQRYSLQSLSAAVRDTNGDIAGVLMLFVSLDFFQAFVENIGFDGRREAFLTDSAGTVIYHGDNSLIGKPMPGVKTPVSDSDGLSVYNYTSEYGRALVCEYALADVGWRLAISQRTNAVLGHTAPILAVAVASLVCWLVAAVLYSRRMTDRLAAQVSRLRDVFALSAAENRYIPAEVTPSDELGELADGYNRMIGRLGSGHAELEDAYAKLRQSEDELRASYNVLYKDEQANIRQAFNDGLTGLPNKASFERRMHSLLEQNAVGGIVDIDMDNFNNINDVLGHSRGDRLLVKVGELLSSARMVDIELCARYGSDEFFVIILGYQREIEMYCKYLLESFEEPFAIDEALVYTTASIGVAMFPKDGSTLEELIRHVDVAINRAKSRGKNMYCFFDDAMRYKLHRENHVLSILQNSILCDEAFLVYQPELSLSTNEITVVEALLRLKNKQLGFISPAEFVPIAEANGLMLELGYWVLEKACECLNRLSATCGYTGAIAVNLSAIQLLERDFITKISEIISRTGIDPRRLQLEVKENLAAGGFKQEVYKLGKIRRLGVGIALDNFGTAYSSLNQMANLPIDILKIDRSFISQIFIDDRKQIIIRTIIETAHKLGLSVVAEGVESYEQRIFLEDNFCDRMQGYVFSAPLDESALAETLRS